MVWLYVGFGETTDWLYARHSSSGRELFYLLGLHADCPSNDPLSARSVDSGRTILARRNGESNPRECLHNFFTCRVSMQKRYRMYGLVVYVDWCCTRLFHALSLDWFCGCIAHKTGRLVQPLVESKSLFSLTWVRKHVSNALVSALRSTSCAISPLNIEPWLWLCETLADECQFASTLSPLWLSMVHRGHKTYQ